MDTTDVMLQRAQARDRLATKRIVVVAALLFAVAVLCAAFDISVRQWQYEQFVIETWEHTTIVPMFEPFEV